MKRRGEMYEMMDSFTPLLTVHAIERIGERFFPERGLPITVQINGESIRGMKTGKWIDPRTLTLILQDIKQAISVS